MSVMSCDEIDGKKQNNSCRTMIFDWFYWVDKTVVHHIQCFHRGRACPGESDFLRQEPTVLAKILLQTAWLGFSWLLHCCISTSTIFWCCCTCSRLLIENGNGRATVNFRLKINFNFSFNDFSARQVDLENSEDDAENEESETDGDHEESLLKRAARPPIPKLETL